MAHLRFVDWVVGKLPALMRSPKTRAFVQSTADGLDASEYRADQAVKQRLPDYAGDEALEAIGFERGLPRYLNETKADYAARLKKAFSLWQYGGTPLGLLRALTGMGYPNVHLLTARGQDHSLDGSGNVVTTVGQAIPLLKPGWNHFVVVLRAPLISSWQTLVPGVASPAHSGTGSATPSLTCSDYSSDTLVELRITTSGAPGSAQGQVYLSGTAFTPTFTLTSNGTFFVAGNSVGLADVTLHTPTSGSYVVGDVYSWHATGVPSIPASASDEANRIRKVIRRWKWGNASFDGVFIQGSGNLWGYPLSLTWGASSLTWGSSWVYWAPTDGLTWGTHGNTWGGGLQWGIPVSSTDE